MAESPLAPPSPAPAPASLPVPQEIVQTLIEIDTKDYRTEPKPNKPVNGEIKPIRRESKGFRYVTHFFINNVNVNISKINIDINFSLYYDFKVPVPIHQFTTVSKIAYDNRLSLNILLLLVIPNLYVLLSLYNKQDRLSAESDGRRSSNKRWGGADEVPTASTGRRRRPGLWHSGVNPSGFLHSRTRRQHSPRKQAQYIKMSDWNYVEVYHIHQRW